MRPLAAMLLALLCGCESWDLPFDVPGATPSLPSAKESVLLFKDTGKDVKATSVRKASCGYLLATYHNKTRANSWVGVFDGAHRRIYSGPNETMGTPFLLDGRWIYPAESKKREAMLTVDDKTGATGRWIKPLAEYATVGIDGYIPYADPVRLVDPSGAVVQTWPRDQFNGIVSGLARIGDEWILSVMDGSAPGIASSKGWVLRGQYPEVAVVGGRIVGFAKDGSVHVVKDGKVDRVVGTTSRKAQRAVVSGKLVFWTTADPDELWVSNLSDMKKLAEWPAGDASNGTSSGSLFNTGLDLDGDGIVVVRSIANGGVELRRVPLD